MFRYYNGGFKTISQIAYEAYVIAEKAQDAVDNLEIGGRNYILQSGAQAESDGYLIWTYEVATPLEAGEEYTVSMCVSPASDVTAYGVWLSTGYAKQCELVVSGAERQIVSHSFICSYYEGKTPEDDAYHACFRVYRLPEPGAGAETGVSRIHWIKVEKGNRATDYTAAPEDGEAALEVKLASVRAQISTEADSIRQEVQATYALASDMTQVRSQVGTLSEQTATNYTWAVTRINQLQQDMDTAQEATEEQLAIIRTYMTFGEDGLIIGKTGNPFTFRVVNDRLSFYMNDTEVAYLSNNKLYVTQAEILRKLVIGRFAFEPQENGNLSLVYNG